MHQSFESQAGNHFWLNRNYLPELFAYSQILLNSFNSCPYSLLYSSLGIQSHECRVAKHWLVCCKAIMLTLEALKRKKAANQEVEVCFQNVPNMWWTSGQWKKYLRHCSQNLNWCCFCLGGDVSISRFTASVLGMCWCISRCLISLTYPRNVFHIHLANPLTTFCMQCRLWGDASKRYRRAFALQSGRSRTICRFFDHRKHWLGPSRVAWTEFQNCIVLSIWHFFHSFHAFFVPKCNRIINFCMSSLICKKVALEKKMGITYQFQ